MPRSFETRDPIHGFIAFSEWERDVIAHPVFQRLRRIRQLAWTEMVYPGAVHTRFEHSLGVMHTATRMFERIRSQRRPLLEELGFNDAGFERDRQLIRFAALLHDVGHSPFSHAGEDVMPTIPGTAKRYKHEHYSAALIREMMSDVIDAHPMNENIGISVNDVATLIEGNLTNQRRLFLRQFVSGQLDADRADYLLRDSYHIGVEYGRYDLDRLLVSMTAERDPETGAPVLAIEEGGWHTAEAVIWARYQMFTQVYFHKTRVAYDFHVTHALQELLRHAQRASGLEQEGAFPPPTNEQNLRLYLGWTDWRALGMLEAGLGGEHGEILRTRSHFRRVYETPDVASTEEVEKLEALRDALGDLVAFVGKAESSWYKLQGQILVAMERPYPHQLIPLSEMSTAVSGLTASNKRLLYVPFERQDDAVRIVQEFENTWRRRDEN